MRVNAILLKVAHASSGATQDRVELAAAHDQARPCWLQPTPFSCKRGESVADQRTPCVQIGSGPRRISSSS